MYYYSTHLAGLAVAAAVPKLDVAGWASGLSKCGWLALGPSQKWLPKMDMAGWALD